MRVLLVQSALRAYRFGFMRELASRVDLTLVQPRGVLAPGNDWSLESATQKNFLSFSFYEDLAGIIERNDYERIIFPYDVHWLGCVLHSFRLPKEKVLWWGMAKGRSKFANRVKVALAKKNKVIVYAPSQRSYLLAFGVPKDNVYVANNSVSIARSMRSDAPFEKRLTILFVGALESRKRLDLLIHALHQCASFNSNKMLRLSIVGDGPMRRSLADLVGRLGMTERVIFHGKVVDEGKLASFYSDALLSCSFGQAGLSVLQSMGYGVPFMTSSGAISGGEIENIRHGVNGFILPPVIDAWAESLCASLSAPARLDKMGKAAMKTYDSSASVERMAGGFLAALSG